MKTSSRIDLFPFKVALSFELLIKFWEKMANERDCADIGFAERLQQQLAKAPELAKPISDFSILERHTALLDALMTAVFPPASWDTDLTAAIVPFKFEPVYATPMFKTKMMAEEGGFTNHLNINVQDFGNGKIINAYLAILRKFYGMDITFDYPIIASAFDSESGFQRYYRLRFDVRFLDVVAANPVTALTAAQRTTVLANINQPDVLATIIPASNFEFRGFGIISAVDVTDQELLSLIKNDLIERESLMTPERFATIEQRIQALLRRKDVQLGLAALPPKNMQIGYGRTLGKSFALDESCKATCDSFDDSIYERAYESHEFQIVDDMAAIEHPTPIERGIQNLGIRSLAVIPLTIQGETIGILELASPNSHAITPLSLMKLRELRPLFAMAIKRSNEELNNSLQAIIKEKCTAIHPSVEWRFRRAAMNLLQKEKNDQYAAMEPIVFENVYPLYGLSDVRGSSTQRNIAIQSDLHEQLTMARNVVLAAHTSRPLPFLDELNFRIGKMLAMIRQGVSSGDEVTVLDFLHRDVESLFAHLEEFGTATKEKVAAYKAAMDAQFGFLYHARKEYEHSVSLINDTISSYIDDEQVNAQAMFPHYFEKYKTDGVDHGMYIGASLVDDMKFDPLYLKNLRLWQLMLMCGVVRKANAIKEKLTLPLDTAHLILVQDQPLAIRFRFDERKFDVDGTYNVRYEIMKKRIDKATLKGSEERLTQPGKIAIVYSQPREANEYKRYIDYLQSTGALTKEVEHLELEELQGVHGLKAMRVAVNTSARSNDAITMTEVTEAVRSVMPQ